MPLTKQTIICSGFSNTALVLLFALGTSLSARAQQTDSSTSISAVKKDSLAHTPVPQTDLGDLAKKILKKAPPDTLKVTKSKAIAILPSIGYNPSMGFIIGAKASAGFQKGDPKTTNYSIFGLEFLYGTNGILTLQARHNIFTQDNAWNYQGNWQLSKYGMVDYGLGTGHGNDSKGFIINEFPTANGDSAFPMKYAYVRLMEKVYRKIGQKFFAGAGASFDIFSNIKDERLGSLPVTPHLLYSRRHQMDSTKYSANGLIACIQYNDREHPLRSYRGLYAELSIRFNQKWLGSTRNATQLQYDIRKYWSLSDRHPAHVLAVWHWASYLLGGELPYLGLPFTASDTYARSGRGYTMGRFKGPSYACVEGEYRFPITRNDFLSGVCFFNLQTASNDFNKKVFQYWEPAGGVGLRLLFQKDSRSTLCVDFAKGRYGSSGIFFGLNEVF